VIYFELYHANRGSIILSIRIGLASRSQTVDFPKLVRVANALSIQVARDAAPIWGVSGTVTALEDPDQIEPGIWPVYIVDDLDPGMGGFHQTEHNQPFAIVLAGDTWSLSASHEVLEMLVDPSGNRLVAAPAVAIIDNEWPRRRRRRAARTTSGRADIGMG
jgi:hypothetical protein